MTHVFRFVARRKSIFVMFALGFLVALLIMVHNPGWEYVKLL